jgi:hypothetical protein
MDPVESSDKLSEIVPLRKLLLSLMPSLADNFLGLFGSEIIMDVYISKDFIKCGK